MWTRIREYLDEKLIRPFRESHAPVQELALGSSVGMFWAMTPLVGIQMYLVTMSWLVMKLVRQRINLAVALAMVWISNPITMGPLYYAFYKAGYITFDMLGLNPMVITFANFEGVLKQAMKEDLIQGLILWGEFLLNDLGWPTMVGGLIIAIPCAVVAYPITKNLVNKHRAKLARKEGLTLELWEAKHIHTFREILKIEKEEHLVEAHAMEAAAHPEEYLPFAKKTGTKKKSTPARKKSARTPSTGKSDATGKKTATTGKKKGTSRPGNSRGTGKTGGKKGSPQRRARTA